MIEYKKNLACNPYENFNKMLRKAKTLIESHEVEKIEEGLGICKLISLTIEQIAKDCASSGSFNKEINRVGIKVKRLTSQGNALLLKAI